MINILQQLYLKIALCSLFKVDDNVLSVTQNETYFWKESSISTNLEYFKILLLKTATGVFKTMLNLSDGTFIVKKDKGIKRLIIFEKKSPS